MSEELHYCCPACGHDDFETTTREGREDWVRCIYCDLQGHAASWKTMAARQSDDARKLMPDERAYRQAISEFSALMFRELSENVVKRGNFMNWYPTAEKAFAELDHHVFKLAGALGRNNPDRITEYCADIANICLGINREFGTSPGPLTE